MRKVLSVVILLAVAAGVPVGVSAQEQNPAQEETRNASFFGPAVKFTSLNEQAGVMLGLRGSWPVGRSLAIGGAYFLLNKVDAPDGALPLEAAHDIMMM